jgi:hypothetical protein
MRSTTKKKTGSKIQVVERTVKAPTSADMFKLILSKALPGKKDAESIMGTIVEAALVSEFSPKICEKKYYGKMRDFIAATMLKSSLLRKEALALAKGYGKQKALKGR